MSMKILSPAGDMESLKAAVFNGADEVYLGVKEFNARNIEGFNISSLQQAVKLAHINNVRVFLAVNILFTDNEILSALDLIIDAYNLGVDAFIIQDVGLINLVKKSFANIEVHASTQLGIHNLEGVKFAETLGIKRVVLARETSIDEIRRITKNSNVEIEFFAHGALCVCFSGNCYLSSYMLDASGNRGKCKQLCRLPYDFSFANKTLASGYLLSAKDFNMLNKLDILESAGVHSIKIEGRARRPYYVGTITKAYKQALNNETPNNEDILLAFNRGFTEGYFNGNAEIISNKQNHIGIEIGEIKKINTGKRFNEIFISSTYPINAKSTLKIFKNNEEIATISAFDITKKENLYKITTTQQLSVGSKVNLISDYNKEQELLNHTKKREVKIEIVAKNNIEITANITINNLKYQIIGPKLSEAKNQPLTEEELFANFNKSEYFYPQITAIVENVFIPKQQLNEFRRNVYSYLENILTAQPTPLQKIKIEKVEEIPEFEDYQFITNLGEKLTSKNIIYSPESYELNDILSFKELCNKNNKIPYLDTPNFATEQDINLLTEIINKTQMSIVVNNVYALNFNTEKIIGGGMNIYNSYSANFFNLPYIKAENAEFKMPYMTLRHCPMKQHLKADCKNCPYKDGYYYTMPSGKKLKLKRKKLSSCTFYLTD